MDAVEAMKKYNGQLLDGKPLKIELLASSSEEVRSKYGTLIRHNKRGMPRSSKFLF